MRSGSALWPCSSAALGATERQDIAREYAGTVNRLIQAGHWYEMPAPEDQLPDDWMPPEFFDYWLGRRDRP